MVSTETATKIIASANCEIIPTRSAPDMEPAAPPKTMYKPIFNFKFFLWLMVPTRDEKGITRRFIPKALISGKPARLRSGILTEPPPIPNIPLMNPEKSPMRRYVMYLITKMNRLMN